MLHFYKNIYRFLLLVLYITWKAPKCFGADSKKYYSPDLKTMNKPIISFCLFLICYLPLSGQDLQLIPIHDTPNQLIRDVILEDVDKQGTKEVLVSFRDSDLILVYNLGPNQATFQKTENDLGLADGALAIADFSGDGQNELIVAEGDILSFQSCATAPFCFDASSQQIIGDQFFGSNILASMDTLGNFGLLGSSTYYTYYYEKKADTLDLIDWSPLFGGQQYRKQFKDNCNIDGGKSILRELYTLEAGNFWMNVEEINNCQSNTVSCPVYFNQPYSGFDGPATWDYTFLFFGDTDLDGATDVLYGKNDTTFIGCSDNPVFFTGKALPNQSYFFDFDGDADVDIISLEMTEDTTYNVVFYEKLDNDLFAETIIDRNLKGRPDFRDPREYFDYPAYLIIDDLNQDGIKDVLAYGASEVRWYNLAQETIISSLDETVPTEAIQVFPNPVEDVFTIKTDYEVVVATLYDMQGRLVETYTPSAFYAMPAEKGIYLLHLELMTEDGPIRLNSYQRLVKN